MRIKRTEDYARDDDYDADDVDLDDERVLKDEDESTNCHESSKQRPNDDDAGSIDDERIR